MKMAVSRNRASVSFKVSICLICLVFSMMVMTPSLGFRANSDSEHDANLAIAPTQVVSIHTPSAPIVITSNSGFVEQGYPGNGTQSDPYLIEGLDIAGSHCIDISNVNVHFIIRDCILNGIGARLVNTSNGVVESCVVTSERNGIMFYESVNCSVTHNNLTGEFPCFYVHKSHNITMSSNNVNNFSEGVFAYESENCTFILNDVRRSERSGLYLIRSHRWIIANNTIESNGEYGIWVHGSDSCIVSNNSLFNNKHYGVHFSYSEQCDLLHNIFENNGLGIEDDTSNYWNLSITGNTVNGKQLGYFWALSDAVLDGNEFGQIVLANCNNVTINEGDFHNASVGVLLGFSSQCIIKNGSVRYNRDGIRLQSSDSCVINMTISDNSASGVLFVDSGGSVENCTLVHNGVVLDESALNNATGTTVNGKILGYFSSYDDAHVNGTQYGQLILSGCTNMTVENGTFAFASRGIQVFNCQQCEFKNCTTENNSGTGVWLVSSDEISLLDCRMLDNEGHGVYLKYSKLCNISRCSIGRNAEDAVWIDFYCHNLTLSNNTIFDNNALGLLIWYYSHNVTILNNTICNNHDGGMLIRESGFTSVRNNTVNTNAGNLGNVDNGISFMQSCYNFTVIGNTVYGHSENGIYADNCENGTISNNEVFGNDVYGIHLYNAKECTLTDNEIVDNAYGITFWSSDNCTISNNTVILNGAEGISLGWDSDYNRIFHNEIGWNPKNAVDDGAHNTWDDDVGTGNAWDDYLGVGVYTLFGSAGAIDRYPLRLRDTVPPTIDSPPDIQCEFGSIGHEITWDPSDMTPLLYAVFRNGTQTASGSWTGENITISVDGLPVGVYNLTLVVHDTGSNNASDTVFVTVVDTTPPALTHPNDVVIEVGALGHSIEWTVSDVSPFSYEILKNDTFIQSGSWNQSSETFVVDLDGLGVGVWNYTILATDAYGQSSVDLVWVTVDPDTTPPEVSHPADVVYTVGNTGNSISWSLNDSNPASYQVYRNGTVVESAIWNTTTEWITLDVDGLSVGCYNYTILATDAYGQSSVDFVWVTVNEVPASSTTGGTTIDNSTILDFGFLQSIMLGSVVVALVVVMAIAARARREKQRTEWDNILRN